VEEKMDSHEHDIGKREIRAHHFQRRENITKIVAGLFGAMIPGLLCVGSYLNIKSIETVLPDRRLYKEYSEKILSPTTGDGHLKLFTENMPPYEVAVNYYGGESYKSTSIDEALFPEKIAEAEKYHKSMMACCAGSCLVALLATTTAVVGLHYQRGRNDALPWNDEEIFYAAQARDAEIKMSHRYEGPSD
jgi:hypothetical protein